MTAKTMEPLLKVTTTFMTVNMTKTTCATVTTRRLDVLPCNMFPQTPPEKVSVVTSRHELVESTAVVKTFDTMTLVNNGGNNSAVTLTKTALEAVVAANVTGNTVCLTKLTRMDVASESAA